MCAKRNVKLKQIESIRIRPISLPRERAIDGSPGRVRRCRKKPPPGDQKGLPGFFLTGHRRLASGALIDPSKAAKSSNAQPGQAFSIKICLDLTERGL